MSKGGSPSVQLYELAFNLALALAAAAAATGALSWLFQRHSVQRDVSLESRNADANKLQLIANHLRKRNSKKAVKHLELNQYEYYVLKDVVLPEEVECSFEDIGGLDDIKADIYEALIVPLNLPSGLMKGKLVQVPKGLLLYGPPGTGKTMMAKAIAKTNQSIFINFSASSLYQMYYGQSEKLLEAFFTLAEKLQPSILFIDEIDTLIPKRGETRHELERRMGGMMMSLWDGLLANNRSQVTVIGATNRPADLDAAILRRLTLSFQIGLPKEKEREHILRIILQHEFVEENFDYTRIAKETENFSGSDLHTLCQRAARAPLRDAINTQIEVQTIAKQERKKEEEEKEKQNNTTTLAGQSSDKIVDGTQPAADSVPTLTVSNAESTVSATVPLSNPEQTLVPSPVPSTPSRRSSRSSSLIKKEPPKTSGHSNMFISNVKDIVNGITQLRPLSTQDFLDILKNPRTTEAANDYTPDFLPKSVRSIYL